MSLVIDRVKDKYEVYRDVPDKELTLRIGDKYPVYIDQDVEFAKDYERYSRGRELRLQKKAVEAEPEPTTLGQLPGIGKSVGGTVARGFSEAAIASPLEAIGRLGQELEGRFPTGLGTDEENFATIRLANAVRKGTRQLVGDPDPDLQDSFMLNKFPAAVGSMAGFMSGGAALKAANVPMALGVASLGASAGGVEGFRRAKAAGADDETAFESYALNALVGTSEALPISRMLSKLNRVSKHVLADAIIEGTEELSQETFQSISGNAIANALTDEDVELIQGTLEDGSAGGLTGFFTSLLLSKARSRSVRAQEELDNTVEIARRRQVNAQAVQGMRPSPMEDLALPEPIRKKNEIALSVQPEITRPAEIVTVPLSTSMTQMVPAWRQVEMNQDLQAAFDKYVQLQRQRKAELQAGGKLPESGQLFQSVATTPGFQETADIKLRKRVEQQPLPEPVEVEISPIIEPTTPLKTVEGIVRYNLNRRDWSNAIANLGRTDPDKARRIVDTLLGDDSASANLSQEDRETFYQLWDKAFKQALLQGPALKNTLEAVLEAQADPRIQVVQDEKLEQSLQRAALAKQREAQQQQPKLPEQGPVEFASEPREQQPNVIEVQVPEETVKAAEEAALGMERKEELTEGGKIPRGFQKTAEQKIEERSPFAFGIAPEGNIVTLVPTLKKFFQKFFPRANNELVELNYDTSQITPDPPSYAKDKIIANRPNGFGRVPGFGWLFDPRATMDKDAVTNAAITHSFALARAQAISTTLGLEIRKTINSAFEFEGSMITNVEGNTNAPRFISDFFEQYQRDPSVYRLTPEQKIAADKAIGIVREVQGLMKRNGVAPKDVEVEDGSHVSFNEIYFPRERIFTREEQERFKKGQGAGSSGLKKKAFDPRFYKSEAEGVGDGEVTYNPDIESRLVNLVYKAYKAIADKNFINDPDIVSQSRPLQEGRLKLGEKTVGSPGFEFKVFPVDTALKIEKYFGGQTSELRTFINDINKSVKGGVFGLDWAAPWLQGQLILFSDNKIWRKAAFDSIKAFVDPFRGGKDLSILESYLRNPDNLQAARELAQLGVPLGRLQDFMSGLEQGEMLLEMLEKYGGFLGKKVSEGLQAAASSFKTFNDIAMLEMWKSTRLTYSKDKWPAAVETLQSMLGRGRSEEIGLTNNRALAERMILLAPSYWRGAINTVATAAGGGIGAKDVRRALGYWITGGMMATLALSLGSGTGWDEALRRLNPAEPDWLTIPVTFPDGRTRNIGLGGSIRSIIRLMAEWAEGTIDLLKDGDDRLFATGMDNPTFRWLRGKLAPVPGLGSDVYLGEDFLGNEVGLMEALLGRTTPLIVQNVHGYFRPGEPLWLPGDLLTGILGFQSWPENLRRTFVVERDNLARQRGYKSYDDAPFNEMVDISRVVQQMPKFVEDKEKQKSASEIEQKTAIAVRYSLRKIAEIGKGLPKDLNRKITKLGIKLRGFDNSLKVGNTVVPLSRSQIKTFTDLIIESYTERLSRLDFDKLKLYPLDRRQEIADRAMVAAKQRARAQLIRTMRQ